MERELPILMNADMVRATLDGRKTQTRRIIKSRHESGLYQVCTRVTDGQITNIESLDWDERNCEKDITPKYKVGDILYVRETYFKDGSEFIYLADGTCCQQFEQCECSEVGKPKWKPSIHMPKEASRIWLEIVNVRAEKLQDITPVDAIDEGVMTLPDSLFRSHYPQHYDALDIWEARRKEGIIENPPIGLNPVQRFAVIWQSINGPESWDENPYVFVYEFKVLSTEGKPSVL